MQTKFDITQIGCGNIGSHLAPLLARLPGLASLTLVDHDTFETRNLGSQQIVAEDVGRPKAERLAARARGINPELAVHPHIARATDVPPGRLRADMIVACVDSRLARQAINQIAFRLGVPWLDTAVGNDDQLARVALFLPGAGAPCFECGFDARDYATLEIEHPCGGGIRRENRATAALGALAASLAALEARRYLLDADASLGGHELLVDAAGRQTLLTRLPRNPACRFDHETLRPTPLPRTPDELTLRELAGMSPSGEPAGLRVEGCSFSRMLVCGCGGVREELRLAKRAPGPAVACPQCGGPMAESGFAIEHRLEWSGLPAGALATPLARLGIARGDILHLESGRGTTTLEITTGETNGR